MSVIFILKKVKEVEIKEMEELKKELENSLNYIESISNESIVKKNYYFKSIEEPSRSQKYIPKNEENFQVVIEGKN
jgi:hypothetical protein